MISGATVSEPGTIGLGHHTKYMRMSLASEDICARLPERIQHIRYWGRRTTEQLVIPCGQRVLNHMAPVQAFGACGLVHDDNYEGKQFPAFYGSFFLQTAIGPRTADLGIIYSSVSCSYLHNHLPWVMSFGLV